VKLATRLIVEEALKGRPATRSAETHEHDAVRAVRAGELITAVRKLGMEVPSASSFFKPP
jgi:hypothetical protein